MKSTQKGMAQFAKYRQYYPDKWAAIGALRAETGIGFDEANQIINRLFGVTDDDERRKADAEHEHWYQQQLAREAVNKANTRRRIQKAGAVAGIGLFAAIKTILNLAKKYE